jgi:predicted nucleotidyltransferase
MNRGGCMSCTINEILNQYIDEIKKIYGLHLQKIILYGSYARGDFNVDSDVDIMILLDISDIELKKYQHQLSYMTYDFNIDNDVDIKPIAKSGEHFYKWVKNYPFYSNVENEGVVLYGAA